MIRLTLLKPDQPPEEIVFDASAELSVGRSGTCSCILDFDPLVSRMHAVFLIDPPAIRIKDLNSTNGLVINGETFGAMSDHKIIHPIDLRDGDEVRIGHTRFIVNVVHDKGPRNTRNTRRQPGSVRKVNNSRIVIPDVKASSADATLDETVTGAVSLLPTVPGYRLTQFISASQTGDVYQAVDNESGDRVAVKIITPRIPVTGKIFEDFKKEVDNAGRLQHPNLAKLVHAGEIDGKSVYLVMEYLEGESLAAFMDHAANNSMSLPSAYNIILQLANAVCHLQSQGFLHMDLKPSSIMINDESGRLRAKITDQGFAGFLDDTGIMPRGLASQDLAKLGYMAPEELSPIQEAKPTADVFSLSAVFYAMLAGRSPYRFESGLPPEEVVGKGMIIPIEEIVSGLPEPLVVIIERGLSADADARYQNVCDLYEALESVWV